MSFFSEQYKEVCSSREVMLAFCESMSAADIIREVPSFGRGSIRNTLVHVINAYHTWAGEFALGKEQILIRVEGVPSADVLYALYRDVDITVNDFINAYQSQPEKPITRFIPRFEKELTHTALTVFTHIITHEFHHKGQVMTMGRMLGHTPPDADVIRF